MDFQATLYYAGGAGRVIYNSLQSAVLIMIGLAVLLALIAIFNKRLIRACFAQVSTIMFFMLLLCQTLLFFIRFIIEYKPIYLIMFLCSACSAIIAIVIFIHMYTYTLQIFIPKEEENEKAINHI